MDNDPNKATGQYIGVANAAAANVDAANQQGDSSTANDAGNTSATDPKQTAGAQTVTGSTTSTAAIGSGASAMTVTSGVDPFTTAEHVDAVAQEVSTSILETSADDTSAEKDLLGALKGYRIAAETRFKELLTGMANSTAEALRCLAEAEIHLADHISQQESKASLATKVEA